MNPTPAALHLPESITVDHKILQIETLEVNTTGASGYICRCPGDLVYKMQAMEREFQLMTAAGDCSITPLCRIVRELDGRTVTDGIIIELATTFDFKTVLLGDRARVKDEIIALLKRLHSKYGSYTEI